LKRAAVCLGLTLFAPAVASCSVNTSPVTLTVKQTDLNPDALAQDFKTIRIEVTNTSAGVARGVTVRDALPGGFSYVSTSSLGGDAIRTRTLDPGINSPSPTWGTWSIPGGTLKQPALLRIDLVAQVGRAPARTPNFVEVSSDNTDTVAAKALLLSVHPNAVVDLTVTGRTPITAGGEGRYTITLRNTGAASAKALFVSAALAPGLVYKGTEQIAGNALRESTTDPFPNSLLPSWGTWTLPPVQIDGSVGMLKIIFVVRVLGDAVPGVYPISVTVTYNNLPAQTVGDQAAVTVQRP
jgi:uncharacterized repeat protein (TIGR01451 family)